MPKAKASAEPTRRKAKAKSSASGPKLYSNFVPIPLSLPVAVPIASSSKSIPSLDAGSSVTHYLFARPHAPKATASEDEQEKAGRTLFVANVPVDCSVRDLRTVFNKFGVVEDVELSNDLAGGDVLEATVRGIDDSDDEDDEEDAGADGDGWTTVGSGGLVPADAPAADDGWTAVGPGGAVPADGTSNATFVGQGGPILTRRQRPRRKANTLPASVPEVAPLPPLDPRETPLGPSGSRSAKIVFIDAVSVPRVMGYSGAPIEIPKYGSEAGEPSGLAYFTAQYAALRPSLPLVKQHADTSMAKYDHLHSLLLSSRAKKHGAGALVDEDGFTVVLRSGRYGRTAGRAGDPSSGTKGANGVAVASRTWAKDALNKKKGKGAGELKDFYKFQQVDRKRKELADMRARFEEDRKKVDELKKTRRYKPY